MKVCNICKSEKSLEDFTKNKTTKDGRHSWCKPCLKDYNQKRYQADPEKYLAQTKAWMKANPEKNKINKRRAKQTDFAKARKSRSKGLKKFLINCAEDGFSPLVCCSGADFRRHIESQFRFGMSWENYGSLWTLDHIRPVSNWPADRVAEADHYSNFQPLLKEDNDRKHKSNNVAPCASCKLHYADYQLNNQLCKNCI